MNLQKSHRIWIAPIRAYQYLSRLFPPSCRYYPTCSEYAAWQFAHTRAPDALMASILRIARCNQLFRGGVDYPLIRWSPPSPLSQATYGTITVTFWLVPHATKKRFYLLKDLYGRDRAC